MSFPRSQIQKIVSSSYNLSYFVITLHPCLCQTSLFTVISFGTFISCNLLLFFSAIPRLKAKAVPSLFAWNHESEERKEFKRKRAERAVQRRKKLETATLCLNTEENRRGECFTFEESCVEVDIENSYKDVSLQCSLCKCEERLPENIDLVKQMNHFNTLNMFRIEDLKEKPDIVHFYTGFDNYNHVMFIFNLFGDEVNNLRYYPSLQPARGKHVLTPANQFYLTLIKLRRNMCNKELSFHFQISQSSVSKYFITWINYLYCKFKVLKVWVPKETIDENVMYQRKTNTCTVIIDCTETKIEKPQNPVSQQATYSTYKSANTLKVLVGISGSGCVTFVSDAYGGSISDRQLFEKCGIMDLLQKGDIILGDRGFNIQDLVSHMDVTVNMPHFLNKGSNQFEAHQLRKSKKLSSERINVERVIGLGKTFKILSNKLSSNLVPLGGRIIFVCFMLANFRKNIM